MKPYYQDTKSGIVIYYGDCREILPIVEDVDLVLTDPNYGINGAVSGPFSCERPALPIGPGPQRGPARLSEPWLFPFQPFRRDGLELERRDSQHHPHICIVQRQRSDYVAIPSHCGLTVFNLVHGANVIVIPFACRYPITRRQDAAGRINFVVSADCLRDFRCHVFLSRLGLLGLAHLPTQYAIACVYARTIFNYF